MTTTSTSPDPRHTVIGVLTAHHAGERQLAVDLATEALGPDLGPTSLGLAGAFAGIGYVLLLQLSESTGKPVEELLHALGQSMAA